MAKKLILPERDDTFIGRRIGNALREQIVGQDAAIEAICQALHRGAANLRDPNRPIATLMLAGPTGVGKTLTAKSLADCFKDLPDRERYLEINCGELAGTMDHAVIKLLGAPPSYAGHDSTPPLFFDEKAPWVVLFDEVEKGLLAGRHGIAQTGLAGLLLKILDEGKITNNLNEEVDFSNSIIILTSNLGSRDIRRQVRGGLGFDTSSSRKHTLADYSEAELTALNRDIDCLVRDRVKETFPPELFNRIDQLIVFRYLTHGEYREILRRELATLQNRIDQREEEPHFTMTYTDDVLDLILQESATERDYGARPLKRIIEKRVISPLSVLVNSGSIANGSRLEARVENGAVVFYETGLMEEQEDPLFGISHLPQHVREKINDVQ
jgi:ATP-dependent Clp protease ATP-binding subunit ClpA